MESSAYESVERTLLEPQVLKFLAAHPLCEGFSPGQIRVLARIFHPVLLPAGACLYKVGDRGESFFLVLRGAVYRFSPENQGANEEVYVEIPSGAIVGIEDLIKGTCRRTSCMAGQEDVLLLKGSIQHFNRLFQTNNLLSHLFIRRTVLDMLAHNHAAASIQKEPFDEDFSGDNPRTRAGEDSLPAL